MATFRLCPGLLLRRAICVGECRPDLVLEFTDGLVGSLAVRIPRALLGNSESRCNLQEFFAILGLELLASELLRLLDEGRVGVALLLAVSHISAGPCSLDVVDELLAVLVAAGSPHDRHAELLGNIAQLENGHCIEVGDTERFQLGAGRLVEVQLAEIAVEEITLTERSWYVTGDEDVVNLDEVVTQVRGRQGSSMALWEGARRTGGRQVERDEVVADVLLVRQRAAKSLQPIFNLERLVGQTKGALLAAATFARSDSHGVCQNASDFGSVDVGMLLDGSRAAQPHRA